MVPLGELRMLTDPVELSFLAEAKRDRVAALAYADWLRDNNRTEEADVWADGSHWFEDISYHGSPIDQCKYCGCNDRYELFDDALRRWTNVGPYCARTCVARVEQLRDRERAEKYEYERLRAAEERYAHLKAKWGPRLTEDAT